MIKSFAVDTFKDHLLQSLGEELEYLIGTHDIEYQSHSDYHHYFMKKYGWIPYGIIFAEAIKCFDDYLPPITDAIPRHIYSQIRKQLPNTKIILWTDDLHTIQTRSLKNEDQLFSYKVADLHITHYPGTLHLFYPLLRTPVLPCYHSCSKTFEQSKINQNAIHKIYVYGATTPVVYPLRDWFMLKMLEHHPQQIVRRDHPGYPMRNNRTDNVATADDLYQYAMAYTATGIPASVQLKPEDRHYLVSKFFEIPGAGVLLLCCDNGVRTELNENGFYDMIHYVNINANNFDEKMQWLFDPLNAEQILKIRMAGHQLVQNKHLTRIRMKNVNIKLMHFVIGWAKPTLRENNYPLYT